MLTFQLLRLHIFMLCKVLRHCKERKIIKEDITNFNGTGFKSVHENRSIVHRCREIITKSSYCAKKNAILLNIY